MARYLGIEITEAQVKAAVLRTAYRKLTLETVERVPRGPGRDGIVQAVATLVAALGGPFDGIYAAVSGADVSVRNVELPKAVLKRGPRVITAALEDRLPFEVETALVDALPQREGGDPVELLAVAARLEKVQSFVQTLAEAGADPTEVGVGPLCLAELAELVPDFAVPGPVLLVHAYETSADLVVLASGRPRMFRTVTGQTTEAARDRALRQTVASHVASGGDLPTVAYVFGDAAEVMAPALRAVLGGEPDAVREAFPLGALELAPMLAEGLPPYAPLAVALALRGVARNKRADLRKGPLTVRRNTDLIRERAPLALGLAAFIMASWGLATYARYQSLVEDRDRLIDALGDVTREAFAERITDPARARALALGQGAAEEQDPLPLSDAFDVMGVMSSRFPEGVPHDVVQLDIQDERVTMQGLVDNLEHRDQIVTALQGYECFNTVTPGRAQRNGTDGRQAYSLEIEMRCPERRAAARRGNTPAAPAAGGAGNTQQGGANGSGS